MIMNEEDFVYEPKPHENNTKLCNACSSGNFEVIEDSLYAGEDINKPNKNGYTSLMCVFDDGNKNNDGYNWNRHIRNRLAYFLVKNGADATKVTPKGENILNVAIKSQFNISPRLIEELIIAGANIENRDKEGCTPLINAIAGDMKDSYYGVIDTLVGNGAELGVKDYMGKTPLMYALERNKFIVAEKLIDYGANLSETDNAGHTVLMYAMTLMGELNENVVDKILTCENNINAVNSEGQSAIHMASQLGLTQVVHKLMLAGADICIKDNKERTPLMYALSNQQYETAQFLIDYGASCNDMDCDSNTVLMYAIHPKLEQNPLLMQELMSKSININEENNLAHTALDMAIGCQSVQVIYQLIKNGANVDVHKALTSAIETDNFSCVLEIYKAILKQQPDYNPNTDYRTILDMPNDCLAGKTLLQTAIQQNKAKLVEALLHADVNPNLSYTDISSLELAVMTDNPKIVDLLMNAGTDIQQTNADGNTPLMVALEQNKSKQIIARLLREEKNIHHKNNKGISVRKMLFQRKDKDLLRLVSKQLSLIQKTRMKMMADNKRQNG